MKMLRTAACVGFALSVVACGPKATKDECSNACNYLYQLQHGSQPAKTAEPDIQKVNESFDKQIQAIDAEKAAALAMMDQEFQAKLKGIKKPADKKKAETENEAAKKAKDDEFAAKRQGLDEKKAQEIKQAEDLAASFQAKAAEEKLSVVNTCTDQCVNQGYKKSKVECQLKALNLDEFNKC